MDGAVVEEAQQQGRKPARRVETPASPAPRGVPAEELAQPLAILDGVLMDVERFFSWSEMNYAALEHAVVRLRHAHRWLHQLHDEAGRGA